MTSQILPVVIEHLLVPVLTAIAAAFGGWILTIVPGPARRALETTATKAEADTHARDVAVLVGTMQRKAVAEVADHATPPPTAADVVAYLERVRPDLVAKMQVQPEALETMAQAAIATATVAATAPIVAAVTDALTPGQ